MTNTLEADTLADAADIEAPSRVRVEDVRLKDDNTVAVALRPNIVAEVRLSVLAFIVLPGPRVKSAADDNVTAPDAVSDALTSETVDAALVSDPTTNLLPVVRVAFDVAARESAPVSVTVVLLLIESDEAPVSDMLVALTVAAPKVAVDPPIKLMVLAETLLESTVNAEAEVTVSACNTLIEPELVADTFDAVIVRDEPERAEPTTVTDADDTDTELDAFTSAPLDSSTPPAFPLNVDICSVPPAIYKAADVVCTEPLSVPVTD